jgi:uncharacterized RDD family membrane protein YckC
MGTGSSPQIDFGHWILRLIAYIIDSIITGIVAWILVSFVLVSLLLTDAFYWLYIGWGYYLILLFAVGILQLLYFIVLDVAWGGTIGKRILGLQVQMVNGSKVTIDKSFMRNISKIFVLFVLLDWLGGIFTSGSDNRQKYTDRMAGTTVVQVSQAFASVSPTQPPTQPPPTQ